MLINGFKNIKEYAKHLTTNQMPFAESLIDGIISNISNDFDNEKRIQQITTPLTILYTHQDDIVNNKDSSTLYHAAKKSKDKVLKQIPGDHIRWDSALVYKIMKLHAENKKSEIGKI